MLIPYIARKRVGKLKVDSNRPLVVDTYKVVKSWVPMNNALLVKESVRLLELLKKAIPQLLSRKVVQRHSFNLFQKDTRNRQLAHLVSFSPVIVDGGLAEQAWDAVALEMLKVLVCRYFVFVAICPGGISLLQNDSCRQEPFW